MAADPPNILHHFSQRVEKRPQAIAINDGSRTLSYQALFDASLAVATTLNERLGSASPDQPQAIGLLIDHSADALIGMLACVFAGRCYVPLDPSFPRKRLQQTLKQAAVKCVLTQSHHLNFAQELVSLETSVLALESIDYNSTANVSKIDMAELDPSLPAYLLYTSGSTGEPKGVWHDQHSLLRSANHYQKDLKVTPTDQIALVLPLQYTPSVFCVFGGLLAGATVCLFDLRQRSIESMLPWLQQTQITLLYATPTIFRRYMHFVDSNADLGHLRSVQLAGEPLYRSDLNQYFARFAEHFSLYNGMGTTETSCLTRYFITSLDDFTGDVVPIGKPYDDVTIEILTDDTQSKNGEMRVQGNYLARGYWRNEALTEQSFTYDPATGKRHYVTGDIISRDGNGNYIYHGRRDSQVKIQGQRVELAEIESALLNLNGVQEAIVLFDKNMQPPLRAFITPAQTLDPIRHELSQTLPFFMVPASLTALDSLPTNTSGKLDRAKLAGLSVKETSSTRGAADNEPSKDQMAALTAFRNALENLDIGIDDDFFALGGDSLAATSLVLELKHLGYRVDASNLIESQTPRKLAQILSAERSDDTPGLYEFPLGTPLNEESPNLFLFPGQGMEPLTFARIVEGVNHAESVFGFDYEPIVNGLNDNNSFSISELAQGCIELLLTASASKTNTKRVLMGFSLGGVVAMEVAHLLQKNGQPIEQLILLDCYSPISMQIRYLKRRYGRHALFGLRTQHQPRAQMYTPMQGSVANELERAAFNYRSQPLTVPQLSIIKASVHRPTLCFFDDYKQWRRLINGAYQEAVIAGDHNELIRSSSTELVAAQIDQWLSALG